MMRRTILLLSMVALTAVVFASPVLAAPGDLDPSFGTNGKVITGFAGTANDVAIRPDGQVVVAGTPGFSLALYNTDGTLDTSFDGDGRLTTEGLGYAYALTLQPDGKVVVAGGPGGSGSQFALARYDTGGSLDTSFDGDGKVTTATADNPAGGTGLVGEARALAIQPDGKIVAAGYARSGRTGDNEFALARYNTDGTLDPSFSGDGKLTTDVLDATGDISDEEAYALALQPDDKLVVAGASYDGFNGDFVLARYNTDGTLDTSFDGDGKLATDITPDFDSAYTLALQPDGKIVAAGDGGLVRYNTDGSLDTSFGGDGKVVSGLHSDSYAADYGLQLQQDGKMVVAGRDDSNYSSTHVDFGLERYNSDGSPDALFSGDGKASIDFDLGPDSASALAIQPDGKIVAAGDWFDSGAREYSSALVRYYGGDDASPTDPVANFKASVVNRDVTLSWTNPTDEDFTATKILRSTGGYATNATQTTGQTKIYEGMAAAHADAALAARDYYYTVFARDDNGNWSAAARAYVDLMPADTTIDSSPLEFVRNTSADFGFTSSEPGSTFRCSLDGAAYSRCTSLTSYSDLTGGSHTFRVRATDASGNADPTPASHTWTVDAVRPQGTVLINGGATTTTSTTVKLRLRASDPSPASGVAHMRFSNDGKTWSPWQTYATSKSWRLTSGAGAKSVYVQYQDRAGNLSSTVRDTIKYRP